MSPLPTLQERDAADEACIQMVKDANWSTPSRLELWSLRYRKSLALEKEFGEEATYVSYMEGRVAGRLKRISNV